MRVDKNQLVSLMIDMFLIPLKKMAIRENDIFQFFAQKNDDTSNIRVNLSRDNFLKH